MPGVEEDPNCSDSINLIDTEPEDHLHYLGQYTGCEDINPDPPWNWRETSNIYE